MRRSLYLGLPLIVVGVLLMAFLGVVGLILGIILVLGGLAVITLGYMGQRSAST